MRRRILNGFGVAVFLVGIVLLLVGLPSATRTAFIGLLGVVAAPVIAFFATRSQERRRARDDAIREERTAFYNTAIRGMLRLFNIDKTQRAATPDEMSKFIADITPEFVLYASRGAVLAWNHFRQVGGQVPPDETELLFAFEEVLREMRKDLGHEVPARANLELLKLFVNDMDRLASRRRKR